jgi:hypothetical protein
VACSRAADLAYRPYFRWENRKAKRASERKLLDDQRRIGVVIDELIAETRPARRVGSHIHRDR